MLFPKRHELAYNTVSNHRSRVSLSEGAEFGIIRQQEANIIETLHGQASKPAVVKPHRLPNGED